MFQLFLYLYSAFLISCVSTNYMLDGSYMCPCKEIQHCDSYRHSVYYIDLYGRDKVELFWRGRHCGDGNFDLRVVCCALVPYVPPTLRPTLPPRFYLYVNGAARTQVQDTKIQEPKNVIGGGQPNFGGMGGIQPGMGGMQAGVGGMKPATDLPCIIGQCIKIHDCPDYAEILENTEGQLSAKIHKRIGAAMCGVYKTHEDEKKPKVCCQEPINVPVRPVMSKTTTSTRKPFGIEQTQDLEPLEDHPNYKLLSNDVCGKINTDWRIVSGHLAAVGEFPWMALLYYNIPEHYDLVFLCGGTLINKRYVLTAGHCIDKMKLVSVRLGELDVLSVGEPVRNVGVEEIIVHPRFIMNTLENDIALIRLNQEVEFNEVTIRPICLPTKQKNITGQMATITGWGKTEKGTPSNILRKGEVQIRHTNICRVTYRRYFKPITDNQLCAGGLTRQDSCAGDSGGPLIAPDMIGVNGRWVQYGIVSFGPNACGAFNLPGVYTRVYKYMRWILDTIKP